MRKAWLAVLVLMAAGLVRAQTGVIPVYLCSLPGSQANVSGLKSINYQDGVIPSCTVTVYLTGTTSIATTTPQSPFTANTDGSIPPISAPLGIGYDVCMSGGIAPNTYPTGHPNCLVDLLSGGPGGAYLPLSGGTLYGPLYGSINGCTNPTAQFGFSPSASSAANKTALLSALSAADLANGYVCIQPGIYAVDGGINLGDVQIDCGGRDPQGFYSPVTLNFTTMASGPAVYGNGLIIGCDIEGPYVSTPGYLVYGSTIAGSDTLTILYGSVSGAANGWSVIGQSSVGIPANTTIASGGGTTTITMSNAATLTTPYGLVAITNPTGIGMANPPNLAHGSITSISQASGVTTVILSAWPSPALVEGATVHIENTTNYNLDHRVTGVNASTKTFTYNSNWFSTAGSESAGDVYYHPTEGVQKWIDAPGHSCCDAKVIDSKVSGFGVDVDLSANQVGAGSTNNCQITGDYFTNSVVGLMMQGAGAWQDATSPPIYHNNVSLCALRNIKIGGAIDAIDCGPMGVGEEGGCYENLFEGLDMESVDRFDTGAVSGVVIGGGQNTVRNSDVTLAPSAVRPQTMFAAIDASQGTGGNAIYDNLTAGLAAGSTHEVAATAGDAVERNGPAAVADTSKPAGVVTGGEVIAPAGTTAAPLSVTCVHAANCSGAPVCYALRGNDRTTLANPTSPYGHAAVSPFVCSVSPSGVAAGPTTWGGVGLTEGGVLIRVANNDAFATYDVLANNATSTAAFIQVTTQTQPGVNAATNYIEDTVGPTGWYTTSYPTVPYGSAATLADTTGGIGMAPGGTFAALQNNFLLTPIGAPVLDSPDVNGAGKTPLTTANLPTYNQLILSQTPALFLRMNDTAGCSSFADSSGNGNTTTAANITCGAAAMVQDDPATSATGNTTNALGTTAANASLPAGDTLTVMGLFKRSATMGTVQTLWAQNATGVGSDQGATVYFNPSNALVVAPVGGGSNLLQSTVEITDTNVHCWAFTKSGASRNLYLDTGPNGSMVQVGNAGTNTTLNPTNTTQYWFSNNGSGPFPGSMADVAIYTTQLLLSTIAADCQEAKASKDGRDLWASDGTDKTAGAVTGSGSGAEAKYKTGVYYKAVTSDWFTGGLPVSLGGTGATTAGAALTALGAQASIGTPTGCPGGTYQYPCLVGTADATGLTNNMNLANSNCATGTTASGSYCTIFSVGTSGAGMYSVQCRATVTTAATTGSATSELPNVYVIWTSRDTGALATALALTSSPATNTVGTTGISAGAYTGLTLFESSASTAIQVFTNNYASNTANQMAYSLHCKVFYDGP